MRRYSAEVSKIVSDSEKIAIKLKHNLINSGHLLLGFLKYDNIVSKELKKYNIDYDKIYDLMEKLYPQPEVYENVLLESLEIKKVYEEANNKINKCGEDKITVNILAFTLLSEDNLIVKDILKSYKVNVNSILSKISINAKRKSELDNISDLHLLSEVKKDPLIGREEELNQLINALCRRNKANAILVGEPGVGKTAIVEELALLLKENKIPLLQGKRIYELDLASTVGGTKYRGEFEEKVKNILKKVIADKDVILFIDEIHNIIKAGGAEGAIDASNIIKPYLSRGEIQLIGATTEDEFQNIFEKDKALKRRFQIIKIEETTPEQTKDILYKNKNLYEKHYSLLINKEELDYIVDVASNYLINYSFPDKALDILDASCVISREILTKQDIDKILKMYYKIDVLNDRFDKDFLSFASEKISGQEDALLKINKCLPFISLNQKNIDRKIFTFLFVGYTGVGKSLCAKIISQRFDNFLILDMNSFQDITSLNKLSGYYGENNVKFIRDLKKYPKTLILLKHIDKANSDVLDFFISLIKDTYFETYKGEKINCSNCVIIMTVTMNDNGLTFFTNKKSKESYIKYRFNNNFLNIIDETIYFNNLDQNVRNQIARNYFSSLNLELELSKIDDVLIHEDEEYIKYGASLIKKDCRNYICENVLSDKMMIKQNK